MALGPEGLTVGLAMSEGRCDAAILLSGGAPTWERPVGSRTAQPITAAVIATAAATSPLIQYVRAPGRRPVDGALSVSIRSSICPGLGSWRSGGSSSFIGTLHQAGDLASGEPSSGP